MRSTLLSRKAVATLLATAALGAVTGFAPAATAAPPASSTAAAGAWQPSPAQQERNKALAVHVTKRLFEHGDLSAADKYIREDYIQHNPFASDGREALKDFVRSWTAQFPDHEYSVKRVLAQGDLVLVHANTIPEPGVRGQAVVDMIRFDKSGKLAEHWEVAQDVPETTVNGNDMFSTVSHPRTSRPGPRWLTPFTEKVAVEYFDMITKDKNPDAVRYLAAEYQQHSPTIPNGSAGLREQFTDFFRQFPNMIVERKRVIAQGDLVAVHAHYRLNPGDRGQAVVDIYRVNKYGKIVEHWDVLQDVPAESANDNTMF
ncbi:nuclear transport factor 2 family protein [Streptomyces sp. NPDC002845]